MIARVWRGWTRGGNADAYEKLLREVVYPGLREIDGYRGGYIFRQDGGEETEFVTVNLFASLEAVRAFAGPEYETPVFEPEARRLLSRVEPTARHYEVKEAPPGKGQEGKGSIRGGRANMKIGIKRVYEKPAQEDGYRILVDRLWPRGLTKEKARIDFWPKELAPSTGLRQWYGHDPAKWGEFKKRYFSELQAVPNLLADLLTRVRRGPATFLYSSKEERLNNAVALKEYLETLQK